MTNSKWRSDWILDLSYDFHLESQLKVCGVAATTWQREFIVDRASLPSMRANINANRICDSSWCTKYRPGVELTDIRRAGEIRTIHTADKPRRVEWSHVSRADNSANSWQSHGVVQDQGWSLFMVTQFSVTSHDCRLARTWSRSHHTTRDNCVVSICDTAIILSGWPTPSYRDFVPQNIGYFPRTESLIYIRALRTFKYISRKFLCKNA